MAEQQPPMGSPGDILNWPMLKIEYRTDKKAIAKLLPPGFTVGKSQTVFLTVYNFPVMNVPEYGCVITVAADYEGVAGEYALAYAIDQEEAVYVSREHWGQPKYLAEINYFRLMDNVIAEVTHAGHTFLEYRGRVASTEGPGEEFELNEWWVKYARDVSMEEGKYDLPPEVVKVYQKYRTAWRQTLEGELILRESAQDPIAQRLPVREVIDAYLWTPEFLDRRITKVGKLDPKGFWPFAQTIGGSRFPQGVEA